MSLQQIQLTPYIISELYRDHLVDIEDSAAPLPVYTPPPAMVTAPEKPEPKPDPKPAPGSPPPVSDPTPVTPVNDPTPDKPIADPPPVSKATSKPKTAPATVNASAQAGANSRIKYLGGNDKRIAFIVHNPNDVHLPDADLEWLRKLLEACRLNLGDVAIANVAKNPFSITDIKAELFSNTVILLGAEPASIQLPLHFPHFNLQQHDGITFLATPAPAQLNQATNEAKLLKSKLWVSLQKLFKLQ